MPICPECESELDVEVGDMKEGDIVVCDECGAEYEVVGVEPLELARVSDDEDDELLDEEGEG
jgi:alpha-aminoadipate/glutamate carrier protein LysW